MAKIFLQNNPVLHAERMRSGAERRTYTAGPLEVNFVQRRVRVNGQEIELTFTEFELLKTLVANNGRIVTYVLFYPKSGMMTTPSARIFM